MKLQARIAIRLPPNQRANGCDVDDTGAKTFPTAMFPTQLSQFEVACPHSLQNISNFILILKICRESNLTPTPLAITHNTQDKDNNHDKNNSQHPNMQHQELQQQQLTSSTSHSSSD